MGEGFLAESGFLIHISDLQVAQLLLREEKSNQTTTQLPFKKINQRKTHKKKNQKGMGIVSWVKFRFHIFVSTCW